MTVFKSFDSLAINRNLAQQVFCSILWCESLADKSAIQTTREGCKAEDGGRYVPLSRATNHLSSCLTFGWPSSRSRSRTLYAPLRHPQTACPSACPEKEVFLTGILRSVQDNTQACIITVMRNKISNFLEWRLTSVKRQNYVQLISNFIFWR